MQAFENVFLTPIKEFLSQTELGADLMLAIMGMVAMVVVFLISLLIMNVSHVKSFAKKLKEATAYLNDGDEITEENVEGFNEKLKAMPESVQRGWGAFLDQKVGYPSDYILARDVLTEKKYSGRSKAGKAFLAIAGALVVALVVWLEYLINKGGSLAQVGLSDFTSNFELVGAILAAFCAPWLVYTALKVTLNILYGKQYSKLEKAFSEFQNALDDKVLIYAEEEDEFVSENIGEINAAIEEIILDKLQNKQIVEIVTAPKIEEKEIVDEPVETISNDLNAAEEELAQIKVDENDNNSADDDNDDGAIKIIDNDEGGGEGAAPSGSALTAEQKQARLEGLIAIIDMACYHDDKVTREQIEELAIILENERLYGEHKDRDKEILEECLRKLAQKYDSMTDKAIA